VKQLFKYLRAWHLLLRLQNLVIIGLVMWVMHAYIVVPNFVNTGLKEIKTDINFIILIISVICIAAAGNSINDYFDVRTDEINRPKRVVLNTLLKRRTAIITHLLLSFLGLCLGFWVAYKIHYLRIFGFHLAAVALLWLYSIRLKKIGLVGNLTIALLSSAVLYLPMIYEWGRQGVLFHNAPWMYFFKLTKPVTLFTLFAFLTSFSRELVKDLEDIKGDAHDGAKTFPIYAGVFPSKMLFAFTNLITAVLLSFILYNSVVYGPIPSVGSFMFILFFLFCPVLGISLLVFLAKNPKHYRYLSWSLKCIMLTGLLYAIIFM